MMTLNFKLADLLSDKQSMQALQKDFRTKQWLKYGIWAYFLLVIFEGALRKWILPGLANPLLVVRDPIGLVLIVMSWQQGFIRFNIYSRLMVAVTLISFVLTLLFGHGNISVALYGARIYMIHFPLMFVIGQILTRNDVLRIGKLFIWLALPTLLLNFLQFYSPQNAWVNRGIGGSLEGAGFGGANGFYRPPGLFSFVNGNVSYWSIVAVFSFSFWLGSDKINRLVLAAATVALLLAIPVSISRTLFFQFLLVILFAVIGICFKPRYAKGFIIAAAMLGIMLALLSQTEMVQTGISTLLARFESASESEGGLKGTLVDRFLGGMVQAISGSNDLPLSGLGLGLGTNVGAILMNGEMGFLVAEEEWARIIGEMGFVLGLIVILIRISFSVENTWKAYHKLKNGDLLPWLLLSFGLYLFMQGQWAQPTNLGFSTLIGGLILATLKPEQEIGLEYLLFHQSQLQKLKQTTS